ncbi:MAG: permease [Candidatus Altiarchaeia archaeon]
MLNKGTIFAGVTLLSLVVSFFLDRDKTVKGMRIGIKMFFSILNPYLNILILISVVMFFLSDSLVVKYLGPDSGIMGLVVAALIGSIALIPAFVTYPVASRLLSQGATYSVVAVFMSTLMLVGVLTLPLEIKYFGRKAALWRNALNFLASLAIGLLTGFLMGAIQ